MEIEEDFSDINLEVESDEVGQGPEHAWYNEYGAEVNEMLQLQVIDCTFEEMVRMEAVADELDLVDIGALDAEVRLTEVDVPYTYQWWLHGVNEIVDDATSAPPESGDVDPETGELVP